MPEATETPQEFTFSSGKFDKYGFTAQQREALYHYLTDADLDGVQALILAGYNEAWAKANGAEFFKAPKFVQYLENHYSKEAVGERRWQFFFRLMQALSATRKMKLGQGSGTKMPLTTVDVPDWQTRINALVQAFKVFGEYAPTKVNVEGDLLAGKTDEEKQRLIAEANAIVARVLKVGSVTAADEDGEGDG